MKQYKKLAIGGIQNKVFNLILFTVILLTAAFLLIFGRQEGVTTKLAAQSGQMQQDSIREITGSVMNSVVSQNLGRSNQTNAEIADAMFESAAQRVRFMADCATKLLAHPEQYAPMPYADPDPADEGSWTAKVIYAQDTDPEDPAVVSKLQLISNLSDEMISLCPAFDAATIYIGLPEGVHFSVSSTSASWFEDGRLKRFDPRQRVWYQKAAETGDLVFTDGEWDASTGAYCIECAMPIYGPDGSLQAVVGTDLFLTQMEQVMEGSLAEGEYILLVNQNGHAVLEPQAERFPMDAADLAGDLRQSQYPLLARMVDGALRGDSATVELGALKDGQYYLTAAPIPSTGWMLISAFKEEIAARPTALLQAGNSQILEQAAATYSKESKQAQIIGLIMLFALVLLTLAAALILGKRIVKPLNTITRRISALSETNLEFKMEDAYRTGDEVQALAEAFASISHRTVVYMDKVVKVTAEKERIGAELSLATQIQAAMLPHIVPAFPDRCEFDVFGNMDPAKEVGGDFFDYFLIDDDHLGLVIADVSGKGVPAALFMMASKIILQSVAMLGKSPAEILEKTNEAICSNNEAEMFVTVWLGILEISTGKLTAANAGHEYPVIRRANGHFELYKDKHGLVIGGMEGVRYREYELHLEPGTKLFVYTDGVPEATDAKQKLFGTQRMLDALNADPDAAPQQVLKNVRNAVDAFVQDAEQFDDLTMLCIEYKGSPRIGTQNPEG